MEMLAAGPESRHATSCAVWCGDSGWSSDSVGSARFAQRGTDGPRIGRVTNDGGGGVGGGGDAGMDARVSNVASGAVGGAD